MMFNKFLPFLALAVLQSLAFAENQTDTTLTVYSNSDPASFDPTRYVAQEAAGYQNQFPFQVPGFGVIKEIRSVDLSSGSNELRISDIAQFIDPTTVTFSDLTDPSTTVQEQTFQFDLASSQKILQRYLDKEISMVVAKGATTEEIKGTLISASGSQLVLKTNDGLQILTPGPQIKLAELPGGLITKPTLIWRISAAKGGKHQIRSSYQTAGITWQADYNVVLNGKDTAADIGAWVTLLNLSGSKFENAKLKLIAGDVQRIEPARRKSIQFAALSEMAGAAQDSFSEKPFFEYHLYTLPRKLDVLSNSTQQITLFPTAKDVKVEKVLVYYGADPGNYWGYRDSALTDRNLGNQSNSKVDIYVRFRNDEENKMGMPLPRGKVRVYKQDDADGTLEFIGEDLIDHTPRDENVLVKLGQAFDVVGERTQTDYSLDLQNRKITESFKIILKNHKDEPQKVITKENLFRWSNWEITQKSEPFEKIDSRTIHFNSLVPARGEKIITYTAKYTW